jgi:hypothetical protein
MYRLQFAKDRPFVLVSNRSNTRIAELFLHSSIHSSRGSDDTTGVGDLAIEEHANQVIFSIPTTSSVWEQKIIRLHCFPEYFTYEVTVRGRASIGDVTLLGGFYSGQPRWGSGFFWSGQNFACGFNPEPDTQDEAFFSPASSVVIDLMGVPLPGRANWFFTPPPFCYCFRTGSDWLSMGLDSGAENSGFTGYGYHGRPGAFHLSAAFEGHTLVAGEFSLPAVSFHFSNGPSSNPLQALEKYVNGLHEAHSSSQPARKPDWWYEPIFCGWGAQCGLAAERGGRAADYATQRNYETFLETLLLQEIDPGTVVLDDKWQLTYGNNEVDRARWPNLPGFIRDQHSAGRKVLLWLKAWDPEGVPVEECITNAAGVVLAVDPTNPAFERRLRASVRRMLAEEGYGADGFKVDFTARVPSGPAVRMVGTAWGLELMRLYLGILYTEAKRIKPDALVITHTPNPLLAGVTDAIRLNDINTGRPVVETMRQRARVAAVACPHVLIDTDDWPVPSRAAWREYQALKPELGVPALYFTDRIDSTGELLEPEDYAMIRSLWARYREGLLLKGVRTRAFNQLIASGLVRGKGALDVQ